MKVSIIISTFNKTDYLKWTLASVAWQTELPYEVIVADDGSDSETRELVEAYQSRQRCLVKYSWIPNQSFRLSRSRNCAVFKSTGDLLIFIDGDCILPPKFVQIAKGLAVEGKILNGARRLLSEKLTDQLLEREPTFDLVLPLFSGRKFWRIRLPLVRDFPKRSWRVFRGFLMVIPRSIFESVGGFNENFRSWGLEDSDFAVRALDGVATIRDGRYALAVLHLHHPEPNKNMRSSNGVQFNELLRSKGFS